MADYLLNKKPAQQKTCSTKNQNLILKVSFEVFLWKNLHAKRKMLYHYQYNKIISHPTQCERIVSGNGSKDYNGKKPYA